MKKIFTLSTALILVSNIFSQGTSVSFCEDFEGYQSGDYIAQNSSYWETWASIITNCPTIPCADDAMISSNQSSTGSNSLYLTDATGQGGPQDIVLPFGAGIPYISGDLEIIANLFVTTSAYMNIQALPTVGAPPLGLWALNMTIDVTGIITIDGGSNPLPSGPIISSFPLNQWTEFKLTVDLTQNIWEVFIDNQSIGSFSNTSNQVSSMNLYPTVGNDFYVDDICFTYIPFTPLAYDMTAVDLNMVSNVAFSAAPFIISGDILNISSNAINSLDVNYSINGGAPIVDNLTGLNLYLFDNLSFNHSITWTPPSTGVYIINIWASNLNGNIDMDQTNDVFTDTIYVWNALTVRRPLIETFTSSTCQPCNPANVTAEALFLQNPVNHTSIKYQVSFPGTGDPYYTNEIGQRMDYYMPSPGASVPRMEIDGGWDQNGNNITQQVLDDYISEPSFINITSLYNINIKTINIEITIDALENIQSNNLVVHAAIIEETTYNNVKTNGETQFENVVKKMVPNSSGTPISSIIGGQQNTLNLSHTFSGEYRLPINANDPIIHTAEHSVEDFSNLMVAVWIQDFTTKEIHQSTISTLGTYTAISYNCINNSCVDPLDGTGQYGSLSECEVICNTTDIKEIKEIQLIYPNPASDKVYISNLIKKSIIKIYDIEGKLVLENKISNKEYVNISVLAKGIYQVKFEGKNLNETRKLIIE